MTRSSGGDECGCVKFLVVEVKSPNSLSGLDAPCERPWGRGLVDVDRYDGGRAGRVMGADGARTGVGGCFSSSSLVVRECILRIARAGGAGGAAVDWRAATKFKAGDQTPRRDPTFGRNLWKAQARRGCEDSTTRHPASTAVAELDREAEAEGARQGGMYTRSLSDLLVAGGPWQLLARVSRHVYLCSCYADASKGISVTCSPRP